MALKNEREITTRSPCDVHSINQDISVEYAFVSGARPVGRQIEVDRHNG